jgi:hypothetical protein
MSIVLVGSSSGSITLQEPAVAGTTTLNLPATSGTVVVTGTTPTLNGITFPATQVPSADANTLDDYEEGTWTPTSPVSLTASTATYQKIGNTVFLNTFIDVSSNSNGATFTITGLPYAIIGASSSVGCFNNNGLDLYAYMDGNGISIRNSSNVSRTCANLSGLFVAFQIYYRT